MKEDLSLNDAQFERMIRALEEIAVRATRVISHHQPNGNRTQRKDLDL
ncbi:MAG: hypothetical protein M0Z65_06210 [Firmicutes bacterium]|nr:hypothetical protein [Bacillota bacterium]